MSFLIDNYVNRAPTPYSDYDSMGMGGMGVYSPNGFEGALERTAYSAASAGTLYGGMPNWGMGISRFVENAKNFMGGLFNHDYGQQLGPVKIPSFGPLMIRDGQLVSAPQVGSNMNVEAGDDTEGKKADGAEGTAEAAGAEEAPAVTKDEKAAFIEALDKQGYSKTEAEALIDKVAKVAKNDRKEMERVFDKVPLKSDPKVWHEEFGEWYAEHILKIEDPDVRKSFLMSAAYAKGTSGSKVDLEYLSPKRERDGSVSHRFIDDDTEYDHIGGSWFTDDGEKEIKNPYYNPFTGTLYTNYKAGAPIDIQNSAKTFGETLDAASSTHRDQIERAKHDFEDRAKLGAMFQTEKINIIDGNKIQVRVDKAAARAFLRDLQSLGELGKRSITDLLSAFSSREFNDVTIPDEKRNYEGLLALVKAFAES